MLQVQWQGPPRGKAFPIECRTFVASISLALTAVVAAAPFTPLADPNPRGPVHTYQNRTWVASSVPYIGLDQLPALQYVWPVPGRYTPPITNRWHQSDSTRFIGLDALTIAQTDWPVPRGYRPTIDSRTWLQNLSQSTLAPIPPTQPPFLPADPVPGRYAYPLSLRTHLADSTKLIGLDSLRIDQYEWPVPKGYRYPITNRDYSQSVPETLLPVPASPPPLSQVFPNPQRKRYPVSNYTFLAWPSPPGPVWTATVPGTGTWTPGSTAVTVWASTSTATTTWTPVQPASPNVTDPGMEGA